MSLTSVQKQVFSLSWLINSAATHKWNTKDLQNALDDKNVQQNIGTWTVVWGPSLYTPSGSSDVANAMFVGQGTDTNGNPLYVVAIAGTNKSSTYDWMTEDFDITPINWPYAQGSQTMQVTTGDNIGLSILLGLTSGGQTLQTFLAGIQNKNKAGLWFTGHSLGGALSPMMTLALMDPNSSLNSSNNVSYTNWNSVSLLATAGPSIGNQAFVDYFFSTLKSTGVNQSSFMWNGDDVVPHAWNTKTMQALTNPNIYGLTLDPTQCLAQTLQKMQTAAAAQSYQMFQTNPAFTGPLQGYSKSYLWTPEAQFLAQTAYQHINAYVDAFGTSWLSVPTNLCQAAWEARLALHVFNSKVCPGS